MVTASSFVLFCFLNGRFGSELQSKQSHPKTHIVISCFNTEQNAKQQPIADPDSHSGSLQVPPLWLPEHLQRPKCLHATIKRLVWTHCVYFSFFILLICISIGPRRACPNVLSSYARAHELHSHSRSTWLTRLAFNSRELLHCVLNVSCSCRSNQDKQEHSDRIFKIKQVATNEGKSEFHGAEWLNVANSVM